MRSRRFATERRRRKEVIAQTGRDERNDDDDKQIDKVPLCAFVSVLYLRF